MKRRNPSYLKDDELEIIQRMFMEMDLSKPDGHKYNANVIREYIDGERKENGQNTTISHKSITKCVEDNKLGEQFGQMFREAIRRVNEEGDKDDKLRSQRKQILSQVAHHSSKPIELMGMEEIKQLYMFRTAYRQMKIHGIKEMDMPISVIQGGKQLSMMVTMTLDLLKEFAPSIDQFGKLHAIICAKNNHTEKLATMQTVGEAEVLDLIRERCREIEKRKAIEEKKEGNNAEK